MRRPLFEAYVASIPVTAEQLIPALLEGRGDLAFSGLTIAPGRDMLMGSSRSFFRDSNEVVVTAPEALKDEEPAEMLNAGLGSIIVVDDNKAELWSQVFTDIRLHPKIQIGAGVEVGWTMRPNSPGPKAEVNAILGGAQASPEGAPRMARLGVAAVGIVWAIPDSG